MYSLTFCVRFLLPELHQRKPAVQAAAVMLRTPPVDGQSPASQPRPLPIYGAQFWERSPSPASQWPAALADPAQPAVRAAGWTGCKVQTCITMTVLLHQFPSMFRSEKMWPRSRWQSSPFIILNNSIKSALFLLFSRDHNPSWLDIVWQWPEVRKHPCSRAVVVDTARVHGCVYRALVVP